MRRREMVALGAVLFLGSFGVWLLQKTNVLRAGMRVSGSPRRSFTSKAYKRRLLFRCSRIQCSPSQTHRRKIAKNAIYTPEDVRAICLNYLYKRVSKSVLLLIFKADINCRMSTQSLQDFYQSRGINIKKGMNSHQKQRIDSDPEGNSFDVTLLYRCLRFGGSQVLASGNDAKWNEEDNGTLESLINTLKNKRNILAHEDPTYSRRDFLKEANKLRRLLTELLTLTRQHYNLPQAAITATISDVDCAIDSYLHGDPDFAKLLLSDYVSNEAKEEVKDQYGKRGDTKVTPLSYMNQVSFEVGDIFTEMKLRKESRGKKQNVRYEHILIDNTANKENPVILIEGRAGVGKTTLVKRLLNEWISDRPSSIKELDNYNLVLLSECRHPKIESYKGILKRLMPNTAKRFDSDALREAALSKKNLIILDGLDEATPSAKKLFREILQLKKDDDGVTVIITTRPEKLEYFYESADHLNIKTKHIQLLGIPPGRRQLFMSKYHHELKKTNPSIQSMDGLLEFLERGGHRRQELWRLPFNLAALILIWEHNSSDVNIITTSIDLYWQMHIHHRRKLKERLTAHINISYLDDDDIEHSMSTLGREALLGLISNDMNLSEMSYQRLKHECIQKQIPYEEVTGAFLKKVFITLAFGFHVQFSFPHKGLQEFFGALHIFKEMQNESQRLSLEIGEESRDHIAGGLNVVKENEEISDVSSSNSTSSEQRSVVVRHLLQKLHGPQPLEIEKYQNLFTILIGLMYLHPGKIENCMKLEVLVLLQETGVEDTDDWLRILDDTKCDDFVATFISNETGILDDDIEIRDSTLNAFNSLLRAFQSPLENSQGIKIILDIKDEFQSAWNYFMTVMDFHKLKVRKINICDENISKYVSLLESPPESFKPLEEIEAELDLYRTTTVKISELMDLIDTKKLQVGALILDPVFKQEVLDPQLKGTIAKVLRSCPVEWYTGHMLPEVLCTKKPMQCLSVSVPDTDSYLLLRDFLSTEHQLEFLDIAVSKTVDPYVLQSLPIDIDLNLFLPNVTSKEDIEVVCDIAKRLSPTTGWKTIQGLLFPRAQLNEQDLTKLLQGMIGVRIMGNICFPSDCRPSTPVLTSLQEQAEDMFGSYYVGILQWGNEGGHPDGSIFDMDSW